MQTRLKLKKAGDNYSSLKYKESLMKYLRNILTNLSTTWSQMLKSPISPKMNLLLMWTDWMLSGKRLKIGETSLVFITLHLWRRELTMKYLCSRPLMKELEIDLETNHMIILVDLVSKILQLLLSLKFSLPESIISQEKLFTIHQESTLQRDLILCFKAPLLPHKRRERRIRCL